MNRIKITCLLIALYPFALLGQRYIVNDTVRFDYDSKNWMNHKNELLFPFQLVLFNEKEYKLYDSIHADNLYFKDASSFAKTKSKSHFFLLACTFTGRTYFAESYLNKADFSFCRFNHYLSLSGVTIDHYLSFSKCEFQDEVAMDNSDFGKLGELIDCQFYDDTFIRKSRFEYAKFDKSHFNNLELNLSRFSMPASFIESSFNKLSLQETQFDSTLVFSKAKFHGAVNLQGMLMPSLVYFDNISEISEEIDFTVANYDSIDVCHINLLRSRIDKIRLTYDKFKLYFPEHTSIEDKLNVYDALLKKFQSDGFGNSYKNLDIEFQQFKYSNKTKGRWFWKRVNWLEGWWWNYGYNKELVFYRAGQLFLFFLIVNYIFYYFISKNVYSIDNIVIKGYSANRVWYLFKIPIHRIHYKSVLSCFFYTCMIFFGIKMSWDKIKYTNYLAVCYLYTQYIIGLVCLAYMANYVITR